VIAARSCLFPIFTEHLFATSLPALASVLLRVLRVVLVGSEGGTTSAHGSGRGLGSAWYNIMLHGF